MFNSCFFPPDSRPGSPALLPQDRPYHPRHLRRLSLYRILFLCGFHCWHRRDWSPVSHYWGFGNSLSRQRPPKACALFFCLPRPEHRRRGRHQFRRRAFDGYDYCGGGSCSDYAAAAAWQLGIYLRQACPSELSPGLLRASGQAAVSADATSAAGADDGVGGEALGFASFGRHGFER